jgi:hypothetical protein
VLSVIGALGFGLGMPLALPGCGGDSQPGMVKPEVAPAVAAKDSMNAYLQAARNHTKGKKKYSR